MKIVGVVNGYREAEDIEEIVKVFVLEQRVMSLQSSKNIDNAESNDTILPNDEVKYLEKSDVKTIDDRTSKDISNKNIKTLFNVRGIS